MEDGKEDKTCDQTREAAGQENRPQPPEEEGEEPENSAHQDVNPGDNPPTKADIYKVDPITHSDNTRFSRRTLATIAIGTAAAVAGIAAAPLIAGAALGAAGFAASGVVAGSAAAAAQSTLYGGYVAAGSLFAACQSAGATGVIGATATGVIGGGTGLSGVFASLGAFKLFGRRSDTIKLLICGNENEAHVFASIASSFKDTDVHDEAERWSAAIQQEEFEVALHCDGEEPKHILSKPAALLTENPENTIRDVDIVVLMLPASAHPLYLEFLRLHIKPGVIIVGLPGYLGFDSQTREILGDRGRQCTIMDLESVPWLCRIVEFGMKCEVRGIKKNLRGAMKKGDVSSPKDPVATLQYLLGPLPELTVVDATNYLNNCWR